MISQNAWVILPALLLASACGFAPLHSGAMLDAVPIGIDAIDGVHGRSLHDLLSEHLRPWETAAQEVVSHRLQVELQIIHHPAAALHDRSRSTARVEIGASSRLVNQQTGEELLDQHQVSLTYPVLRAPVASLAAREEATDRALQQIRDEIIRWITLQLRESKA